MGLLVFLIMKFYKGGKGPLGSGPIPPINLISRLEIYRLYFKGVKVSRLTFPPGGQDEAGSQPLRSSCP